MDKILKKLEEILYNFVDIVHVQPISEGVAGLYTQFVILEYRHGAKSLELNFRASTSPDDAVLIMLALQEVIPKEQMMIGRIFEYDDKTNQYYFGEDAKRYNIEALREICLRSYRQRALLMSLDDNYFGNA